MAFVVALHTLNVSIDIDHLTSRVSWYNSENFDDDDSFVELFVEYLLDDDNFMQESNTDDGSPLHKISHKHVAAVEFYWNEQRSIKLSFEEPSTVQPNTFPQDHSFTSPGFAILNPRPPRIVC